MVVAIGCFCQPINDRSYHVLSVTTDTVGTVPYLKDLDDKV